MGTKNSPLLVVIACKIFQGLLEKHLPPQRVAQLTYLDYGLHSVPRKLRETVQEHLDALERPSLVTLGYGLCGNGLHGIKARQHTLLLPRTDDCIGVLLGSYHAYREQFDAEPGTYYLSKGWLESGSNPLEEYKKYEEIYGPEQAAWLMDTQYKNYKRLAFVAHNLDDLENFRPQAQDVAEYCQRWGMRYEEILGSDDYVRQLVEVAFTLDQAGEDFLVIPPGGEITQDQFLRL
jgi:hypothetical protein